MDENKQFDNDGAQITTPPTPAPPPRYRHEHEHEHEPHRGGRHGGACGCKEDAFVLKIKWRHVKLAMLLLAAFMLGSFTAKLKYYHSSYATKVNASGIERIIGGSQSRSFSIGNEAVTTVQPHVYYVTPEVERSSSQNSDSRIRGSQKSDYYYTR